jgi:hypothetical protein
VARNILGNMEAQLKSILASGNKPAADTVGPTQNLFQSSENRHPIGQIGDTNTPPSPGSNIDSAVPRQGALIPKGPGIINPALIKRRFHDPSLIPEYSAPYVPTTQGNDAGDTDQDIQSGPDSTIKTSGIGTDYFAARDPPLASNTGPIAYPVTGTIDGALTGSSSHNVNLTPGSSQGGFNADADDALAINTIPIYVTDLDERFSAKLNNMSRNVSRVLNKMGKNDYREAVIRSDERNLRALDAADKCNRSSFDNIQETLTAQATAIEAQSSDFHESIDRLADTLQTVGTVVAGLHTAMQELSTQVTTSHSNTARSTDAHQGRCFSKLRIGNLLGISSKKWCTLVFRNDSMFSP